MGDLKLTSASGSVTLSPENVAGTTTITVPSSTPTLLTTDAEGSSLTGVGGDLSFGGDTFGADKTIGSNDNYALSFETNATERLKLTNDGRGLSQFTAKVWCNFNQNTATILDSHNVSSLTDSGTGDFTVNFTNNLDNANYAASGNSMASSGCDVCHDTTSVSAVGYRSYRASDGTAVDKNATGLIIFGD